MYFPRLSNPRSGEAVFAMPRVEQTSQKQVFPDINKKARQDKPKQVPTDIIIRSKMQNSEQIKSDKVVQDRDLAMHCHSSSKKKKQLRFGSVHIRYYGIVLSENPGSVTMGPSLELGWEYDACSPKTVDYFEEKRRRYYSKRNEMIITPNERWKLLERTGYTSEEIMRATFNINSVKKARWHTFVLKPHEERVQERIEAWVRSIGLGRRWKKSRDNAYLWQKASCATRESSQTGLLNLQPCV